MAALAAVPAHAQKAPPLAMCDGKYTAAAEIAGQAIGKYGTVYSGGLHWHRLDNIGGTLDLYRLWRGYPDVKLRSTFKAPGNWDGPGEDPDFSSSYYYETSNVTPDEVWVKASWALRPGGPATPTRLDSFWAGYGLDRLTSVGPSPDWWRKMTADSRPEGGLAWVAAKARTEPGLDWLQYVIAASGAEWANSWAGVGRANKDTRDAYHGNAVAAFAHCQAGDGVEWLVAAAINEPQIAAYPALAAELHKLREEVKACIATPARYAAYAAVRDVMERDVPETPGRMPPSDPYADMPEQIRNLVATNALKAYMVDQVINRGKFDKLPLGSAGAYLVYPYTLIELARLYGATRIEDVPTSDAGYVGRAYNLLSVDHLAILAQRTDRKDELIRNDLIQVVFARRVALGRTREAVAFLPTFKATLKADLQQRIDRIWAMRQPERTRLALIALETPNLSTLHKSDRWDGMDDGLWYNLKYVQFRRNLPAEYATGEFMQRDFETAMVEPNRYYAFRHMRGYSISWIERISQREGYEMWTAKPGGPSILPGQGSPGVPFMKLIAHDEIRRLTSDQRLTMVIAPPVLEWADAQSRIPAMREEAATTLAKLITMCKYNDCGKVRGQPAGQRALQIVNARLKKTNAGRRTRWWFAATE